VSLWRPAMYITFDVACWILLVCEKLSKEKACAMYYVTNMVVKVCRQARPAGNVLLSDVDRRRMLPIEGPPPCTERLAGPVHAVTLRFLGSGTSDRLAAWRMARFLQYFTYLM
jgi:hypothetical protein